MSCQGPTSASSKDGLTAAQSRPATSHRPARSCDTSDGVRRRVWPGAYESEKAMNRVTLPPNHGLSVRWSFGTPQLKPDEAGDQPCMSSGPSIGAVDFERLGLGLLNRAGLVASVGRPKGVHYVLFNSVRAVLFRADGYVHYCRVVRLPDAEPQPAQVIAVCNAVPCPNDVALFPGSFEHATVPG